MGLFSPEHNATRNKRDEAYIRAYNEHYNDDNGLLPLYQLPNKCDPGIGLCALRMAAKVRHILLKLIYWNRTEL